MTGGRQSLVNVYSTGNLIPAIVAVLCDAERNGFRPSVTIVLHSTAMPDESAEKHRAVIERITEAFGWDRPIVITVAELRPWLEDYRVGGSAGIGALRQKLGGEGFDSIFYAHDLEDGFTDMVFACIPDARKVLYGDAFGSVYDRRHVASLMGVSSRSVAEPEAACSAALILPADHTGRSLEGADLLVAPRSVVIETIDKCVRQFPEIARYEEEMLRPGRAVPFLFLLENFSEGRFMFKEEETALYSEAVRQFVPRGSRLLLKPHPLASSDTAEAVVRALGAEYECTVMPDSLAGLPVEFFSRLATACPIVSMSSSLLSIYYLYGRETVFALDRDLVRKYFHRKSWAYFEDAADLLSAQMTSLRKWDGKGIMWKGSVVQTAAPVKDSSSDSRDALVEACLRAYVGELWLSMGKAGPDGAPLSIAVFGAGRHSEWLENVTDGIRPAPRVTALLDDRDNVAPRWGLRATKPDVWNPAGTDAVFISTDTEPGILEERCRRLYDGKVKIVSPYRGFPPGPYPKHIAVKRAQAGSAVGS